MGGRGVCVVPRNFQPVWVLRNIIPDCRESFSPGCFCASLCRCFLPKGTVYDAGHLVWSLAFNALAHLDQLKPGPRIVPETCKASKGNCGNSPCVLGHLPLLQFTFTVYVQLLAQVLECVTANLTLVYAILAYSFLKINFSRTTLVSFISILGGPHVRFGVQLCWTYTLGEQRYTIGDPPLWVWCAVCSSVV